MATFKQFIELGNSVTLTEFQSGFTLVLDKRGGVNATSVLTFTGQPANTNTVVIGGKTYTFLTTLTQTDGAVLIGANVADSINNLKVAIDLGPGAGALYGGPTTKQANVTSFTTATTLTAQALEIGTGGNAIAIAETIPNATWTGGAVFLTGGSIFALANQNFVITLDTSPVDGTNHTFMTKDNGITVQNGENFFTNWIIQSPIVDGFVVRGDVDSVPRVLNTSPTDNQPFTHESLIIGFSGTTQNSQRRFEAGESIDLTFFDGKWRGNLFSGSRILGIGDI